MVMTPDQFRAALNAAGMSQRAFAARSGVAVSSVNRWAQGTQPIPGWVPWVLALLHERKAIADQLSA